MKRTLYKREAWYKHIARNEAAEMQERIVRLSIWVAEHQTHNAQLLELFNKKIDAMAALQEVCDELVKFKVEK